MKKILLSATALTLLIGPNAWASVTPNGNYYTEFVDAVTNVIGVKREMDIRRTYNSFSTMPTWFGIGWSSDLQNKVFVLPGGDIVLFQNGTENTFDYTELTPAEDAQEKLNREAATIAEYRRIHGHLTADQAREMEKTLLTDHNKRRQLAIQEGLRGTIKAGQVFRGKLCATDYMRALLTPILDNEGNAQETLILQRELCRGGSERYDLQGRLIQREPQSDYHFTLHYNNKTMPQLVTEIQDSQANRMIFNWTSDGLLKGVDSLLANGETQHVHYEYKNRLLASATNSENTVYNYSYDKYGNLERIEYDNGSHRNITYDEKQRVIRIVNPDGTEQAHQYGATDPGKPENLPNFTTVTDQELREIDPTLGKLTRLKNEKGDFRYRYNEKGQLISASRDNLLTASIEYDEHENLIRLAIDFPGNEPEKVLRIKYDDKNRARKLIIPGKGYLNIRYDRDGEMEIVPKTLKESDALDVFGLFGTLNQLVKPASIKVPLSPSR